MWGWERKIHPRNCNLHFGITRQASWCQTAILGTDFYSTLTLMIDFHYICMYNKAPHILHCIKPYDRIHKCKENVLLLQASCGAWIYFLIACSTFGVGFVYCVLQTGITYNINEGTKTQLILLRLRASLCIVDAILMVVCIL